MLNLSKSPGTLQIIFLACLFCIFATTNLNGQKIEKIQNDFKDLEDLENPICPDPVYTINTKRELILTGVGVGLNLIGYAMPVEGATIERLSELDENDLWSLDRSAIYNNSQTAQNWSDVILYSSMTLPFLVYADMKCRAEGWKIGLMGLQTFLITNGITTITKSAFQRYRPFTYNPDVSLEKKQSTRSTLSFFSGHTSVTTSLSFFASKVITDLRPGSKNNWIVWTVGATTPALMGYLRYEAGKHFLTDVITGYAVGAIVGYMVPAMHLNKNVNVGLGLAGTLDFRLTF
ncbi:MAG: phosphatase PAP2 family protein [Bacteroidota bacterium]